MKNSASASGFLDFGTHFRAVRAVPASRTINILLYVFFVAVPFLVGGLMLIKGEDLTKPALLGLPEWAGLLLGPFFAFVFIPGIQALNVWQHRKNNKSIAGDLHYKISEEGFESHGGSFQVKLNWAAIHRVVETKHFLFFYVASASAQFIPKSWITSPGGLADARTIIRSAIGDRAKLKFR